MFTYRVRFYFDRLFRFYKKKLFEKSRPSSIKLKDKFLKKKKDLGTQVKPSFNPHQSFRFNLQKRVLNQFEFWSLNYHTRARAYIYIYIYIYIYSAYSQVIREPTKGHGSIKQFRFGIDYIYTSDEYEFVCNMFFSLISNSITFSVLKLKKIR